MTFSGRRIAMVVGVCLLLAGGVWLLLHRGTRPALRVVTRPSGAHLSLDGKSSGTSPATLGGLPAGDHVLVVEHDGAPPLQITFGVEGKAITLRPGYPGSFDPTHHELALELAPPQGMLTVTVNPPGADIWVDGTLKAEHANGAVPLTLKEGDHQLSIRAAGFKEAARAVHIAANAHDTLEIALQKNMPTLTLSSKPSGGVVRIDGVERGRTPVTLALAAGHHQIEVSANGFNPRKLTVDPSGGETLTILAELEPVKVAQPVKPSPSPSVAKIQFRSSPGSPAWRKCHLEMLAILDDVRRTPRHKSDALSRLRGQLEGEGASNIGSRLGTLRGILNHALSLNQKSYLDHRQTMSQRMCAVIQRI